MTLFSDTGWCPCRALPVSYTVGQGHPPTMSHLILHYKGTFLPKTVCAVQEGWGWGRHHPILQGPLPQGSCTYPLLLKQGMQPWCLNSAHRHTSVCLGEPSMPQAHSGPGGPHGGRNDATFGSSILSLNSWDRMCLRIQNFSE